MISNISRWYIFAIIIISFSIMVGCSDTALITPDTMTPNSTDISSHSGSSHNFMGYNLLSINTENGNIDVIPLRNSNLHLNLVDILNATMGVTAAGVPSQHDPPNGIFVFDITLEHPFATKPQFAGFDVKGILISDGDAVIDGLNFADLNDTRLLNADGYTRWWNPAEFTTPGMFGFTEGAAAVPGTAFTATCNPYKMFCDRLEATDSLAWVCNEPLDSDMGRAVFTAGASNTRRYEIKFKMSPDPVIYYGYAIDCAWGPPSPNPPAAVPDDFPIESNQPEAYRVGLNETFNSLYFDTQSGFGGGTIEVQAGIFDWQGQAADDYTGEIQQVQYYCPELEIDGEFGTYGGKVNTRVIYDSSFGTLIPTSNDELLMYVGVLSGDGSTYEQTADPAPDDALKAWQTITIDIVDPPCEADSNNSMGEAVTLVDGEPIVGTLCGGSDDVDYYTFEIPFGSYFSGSIAVHSNMPSTASILTDAWGNLLETKILDGWHYPGSAGSKITSGTYYLYIITTGTSQAGQYVISPHLSYEEVVPETPADVTPENLSLDANWVFVEGDYLYCANEYFVWVYDNSDTNLPVFMNRTEVRSTEKPAFNYPYMYFLDYDGAAYTTTRMIDFTDPAAPEYTDLISTFNADMKLALLGSDCIYYAYINNASDWRVSIWDYSANPKVPVFVKSFIIDDSTVKNMALMYEGTTKESLILCQSSGLFAWNIFDTDNITLVDQVNMNPPITYNKMMAVSGEYIASISYFSITGNTSLNLYRYTDGLSLDYQHNVIYPDTYEVTAIDAYGSWIVVGSYTGVNKLNRIYSFADPTNIEFESQFQTRSHAIDFHHDQYTLVAMQEHYAPRTTDITGFVAPGIWSERYKGCNYPTNAVIVGNYLYALVNEGSAHYVSGINLTFPPDASVTEHYNQGYVLEHLCGNDKMLSWTRANDQLYFGRPYAGCFFDTGHFNLSQNVAGIAVSDEYLYATLYTPPLMKVYNTALFPASDPTELPDASITKSVKKLIIHNSVMYGFYGQNMYIFDLSTPSAPVETGSYPMDDFMQDRLVYGDYLYLMLDDGNLEVIDISDPLNPVYEATYITLINDPFYITRMEQYLIISNKYEQPEFVDISDPASPVFYGSPITDDVDWEILGLESSGEYLYQLTESFGARIFECY